MDGGADARRARYRRGAVRLSREAIHLREPRPEPFPTSFVVKKGSNTEVSVSLSMPQPVSLARSRRNRPTAGRRDWMAARSCSPLVTNCPPSGHGVHAR